jgi:hypothetical protein
MTENPHVPDPGVTIPFKRGEHGAIEVTDTPPPAREASSPTDVAKASPLPTLHLSSFSLGFVSGFALASCTSGGAFVAAYFLS